MEVSLLVGRKNEGVGFLSTQHLTMVEKVWLIRWAIHTAEIWWRRCKNK